MDRDRDATRGGRFDRDDYRGSNTYRPRPRSPRSDDFRSWPSNSDRYIPGRPSQPRSRSPGPYRRRSRSPGGYRAREADTYRARPGGSPRARGHSPRRDDYGRDRRARSPATRDFREERYSRDRSPPQLKRGRDLSPAGSRGYRSPPPKSLRTASPPRNRYDDYPPRRASPRRRGYSPPRDSRRSTPRVDSRYPRSRSPPPRRERPDPYASDDWRKRSASPQTHVSHRESDPGSRRASPPIHPNRSALHEAAGKTNSLARSSKSPHPHSPYKRSPPRKPSPRRRPDSPPRQDPEIELSAQSEPAHRNGETTVAPPPPRGPPTGPSAGSRGYPPAGPSGSSPSMAPGRSGPGSVPLGPSQSRSAGVGRGGYGRGFSEHEPPRELRDYPTGPPGPRRGSSNAWPPTSRGRGGYDSRGGYDNGPSRGSSYDSRGGYDNGPSRGAFANPTFRGSSSSSTYPRTQRFNQPSAAAPRVSLAEKYLSDIPSIKEGGEKLPLPFDTTKLRKLEDEAAKMRREIDERTAKRRQSIREWDCLERESANAGLRSELAESSLRALNGESTGGAAAF